MGWQWIQLNNNCKYSNNSLVKCTVWVNASIQIVINCLRLAFQYPIVSYVQMNPIIQLLLLLTLLSSSIQVFPLQWSALHSLIHSFIYPRLPHYTLVHTLTHPLIHLSVWMAFTRMLPTTYHWSYWLTTFEELELQARESRNCTSNSKFLNLTVNFHLKYICTVSKKKVKIYNNQHSKQQAATVLAVYIWTNKQGKVMLSKSNASTVIMLFFFSDWLSSHMEQE